MMTVTLETLEMNPDERNSGREAVQKMAYFNWLNAGYPAGGELDFWLHAEHEWIEHNYVPNRTLDGKRPQPVDPATTGAAKNDRPERTPSKPRRCRHVKASVQ